MDTFFTSDTHFGHTNVIEYCNRPFASAEEMDEAMIQAWNDTVSPKDTVFHLGDFAFSKVTKSAEIFARLNGSKHLIVGNHDKDAKKLSWTTISNLHTFRPNKDAPVQAKIVLCHYPLEVWNKSHAGTYHLHGHSHGSLKSKRPRRMDIGVDATYSLTGRFGAPLSFDQVIDLLKHDKLDSIDHHGSHIE